MPFKQVTNVDKKIALLKIQISIILGDWLKSSDAITFQSCRNFRTPERTLVPLEFILYTVSYEPVEYAQLA